MSKRVWLCVVLFLAAITIPAGSASARPQYTQVTIVAQWTSPAEREDFISALVSFSVKSNIQPTVVDATDTSQSLVQYTPDILILTQPGLLQEFVAQGSVVDLGAILGDPPEGYPAELARLLTVNGTEYGRFVRLTAKSLVWYNPAQLARGGFAVPENWDQLLGTAVLISGGSVPAWAIGLADPEMGTDIIETILLQRHGPDLLDGLVDGSVSWTDARVREAWEEFGVLLGSGLAGNPVTLTAVQAALAPFATRPTAMLSPNPSTAYRWITAANRRLRAGTDLDFFVLPAGDAVERIVFGGDFLVVTSDNPAARDLAAFIASPEMAVTWASRGSALSPYPDTPYPNGVLQEAAALIHNGAATFDLSARLDSATRRAFYDGVIRYATDRTSLDSVLESIESAG